MVTLPTPSRPQPHLTGPLAVAIRSDANALREKLGDGKLDTGHFGDNGIRGCLPCVVNVSY